MKLSQPLHVTNLGFMSPVSIPLANVILVLKCILNSEVSITGRNQPNGFHWETGRHLSKIMDSIPSSAAKRSQERLCWGQIWTLYLIGRQLRGIRGAFQEKQAKKIKAGSACLKLPTVFRELPVAYFSWMCSWWPVIKWWDCRSQKYVLESTGRASS